MDIIIRSQNCKDYSLNMGIQKISDEIYEKLAGSVDND